MKIFCRITSSLLLCLLINSGFCINPFSYDNSAATECLTEPPRPNYGGLLLNHDFENGIKGWTVSGSAAIRQVTSNEGNKFIVVHNRTSSSDGVSQTVQLQQDTIYSFSAWIKVIGRRDQTVGVVFRTSNGKLLHGGEVMSKNGCWSLLKGGIVADFSGLVDIFLKSKNTTADFCVDNVSLRPFTKTQWRLEQDQMINKIRKSRVRFQVTYPNKTAVREAQISISQTNSSFLFGCGMNHHILESKGYQDWFTSRFKITSFTNEMKWYTTEKIRGQENYTLADSMLKFAQDKGILVRGHNVLWDDPKMQPQWVQKISSHDDLMNVTINRINSVVSRYAGKLTGWDVVNENVHFGYFEDMLGENASARFYNLASKLDPEITLFVNEYNTIEYSRDEVASPANVKKRLEQILAYPGNEGMKAGIGLQGHFGLHQPNIAYMRSGLDTLGEMGFPVWLTEVDMPKGPDQVKYVEEILREAYSHPAVKGIIIFGGPEVSGFQKLTLADSNFNNTPTGDLVDKLLDEWKTKTQSIVVADNQGGFSSELSIFHGRYNVTVRHPLMEDLVTVLSLEVTKELDQKAVHVVLDA